MVVQEGDGNGWVVSDAGDRRWGRFGAAGLLLRAADPTDPDIPLVLLQHRAVWTASGDTWALPGGARDSHEDAAVAALRETEEEAEIRPADVVVRAERVTSRMPGTVWHRPGLDMRHVARMLSRLRPDQNHPESDDDNATTGTPLTSGAAAQAPSGQPDTPARGGPRIPPLVQISEDRVEWTYTTVVADAPSALETVPNNESLELRWVPETLVSEMPLMPAFAAAWADGLRTEPVELVVDVANVLGSRPNGWWKDRAGATATLLDELGAGMPRTLELPADADDPVRFGWVARAHAVIEGAARAAEHSGPFVVHRAAGEGDDSIVDLATELDGGPRRVVVVTADRGLRARLPEDVVVVGPRALLG
ncbi:NUDIX domain-containing protein [Dietzia aurantiaca]|uniref:NUDIX domain-containing protein n=1 Tax=Dietzia aurantiaca TaxID=983873 RepID=UPI001E36824D|nr:NUDIX domain-containing protein [Dietzia aurantiaca]MCD2261467.1 NUDIX domain-containing protein [Dietzia aurantiaca]